jgi:malonyl CoA-acyl carrier protein transacylase
LGEIAALTYSGAASLEEGFKIVCKRGELMQEAAEKHPAAMAAVLKLPPMWVYFLLCTDEFVKWPWVIGHYRSRKWLRNITRENVLDS